MAVLYDLVYIFCNLTSVSERKTINWMKMQSGAKCGICELAIELATGYCWDLIPGIYSVTAWWGWPNYIKVLDPQNPVPISPLLKLLHLYRHCCECLDGILCRLHFDEKRNMGRWELIFWHHSRSKTLASLQRVPNTPHCNSYGFMICVILLLFLKHTKTCCNFSKTRI